MVHPFSCTLLLLLLFSQMASSQDVEITSSQHFSDLVYQKPKAFFVQFYSSKDASSLAFAPIWKRLAANIDAWSNVVQIAKVDCELDSNAALCKDQNLSTYPTLKYFKYQSTGAQDGQTYDGKKSTQQDLADAIARYVVADYESQKPAEWPNFALAHDNKPGENLWHQETHYLALIFEQYPSSGASPDQMPVVGAQVILDYSKDRNILVRRGTSRHQLGRASDIAEFPGLLMYSRSHAGSPVYKSRDGLTREEILAKMNRYMDVTSKEHGHEKPAARDDL